MTIITTPARKDADPEEMDGHRVWRDTSEAASATIELTRMEAIGKLVAWATEAPATFFNEFDLEDEFPRWAAAHRRSFDKHFPLDDHVDPKNITFVITG